MLHPNGSTGSGAYVDRRRKKAQAPLNPIPRFCFQDTLQIRCSEMETRSKKAR